MKKRTINNTYQIPPPPPSNGQWRKLISRIQRPYKMAKFEKQLFNQKKFFFGMTLLHAHAQYIYIVNAKYQKPSVKALVQVDFPVYAQAKSLFKSKQEKNGSFQKAVILSETIFWHQTSSCKCSMSLYCVGKVLNCFGTSCGTSWIPRIYTIYTHVIQNC